MAEESATVKRARKININNVIKAMEEMNNKVAERLEKTQNMKTFVTHCKDPATYANYPSCGLIYRSYRDRQSFQRRRLDDGAEWR
eukprot:3253586-Amphidinium_carterae.1